MKKHTFILRIVFALLLIAITLSIVPVYIYVTVYMPKRIDPPIIKELEQDVRSTFESVHNLKLVYLSSANMVQFELKGKNISDSEMASIILLIRDSAAQAEFQEALPSGINKLYLYCYDSSWDSGDSKVKYEFTTHSNNHSNSLDNAAPNYLVWEGVKYCSDHNERITMDKILDIADAS